ncbi:hypothetical protein KKPNMP14_56660 [Klebsiella pneumoniae subsp. pneumoniae MP14]|nr:hypothetical protein KKPNMP14_56660 [Klebsiella pneumoniae subsp. pneumoniae MP14]
MKVITVYQLGLLPPMLDVVSASDNSSMLVCCTLMTKP